METAKGWHPGLAMTKETRAVGTVARYFSSVGSKVYLCQHMRAKLAPKLIALEIRAQRKANKVYLKTK